MLIPFVKSKQNATFIQGLEIDFAAVLRAVLVNGVIFLDHLCVVFIFSWKGEQAEKKTHHYCQPKPFFKCLRVCLGPNKLQSFAKVHLKEM